MTEIWTTAYLAPGLQLREASEYAAPSSSTAGENLSPCLKELSYQLMR
jgi:hypothetical protein